MSAEPPCENPAAGPPLRPVPTRHLVVLCLYWLANTVMWGALLHLALQSRLTDWFGEAQVGTRLAVLGGIGGVFGTLAQLIFGAFSDRSLHRLGRRRPFVIVGSITGAISLMILGYAPSFWPFVIGLVLVQITTNFALGPFSALLPDTVPAAQHGAASGWMGLARLVGDTGGLALAALLLGGRQASDFPTAALYAAFHAHQLALMCGLLAVFMLLMMALTVFTIPERPLRERPSGSLWSVALNCFRVDLRGNRDFLWLNVSRAVTNLGIYAFLEYMRFYLQYTLRVANPDLLSMLVLLPAIAGAMLASLPSGVWSDRLGRKPLLYAGQVLIALGALGVAVAPSVGWVYVAAVPAGLGYGVFTAVEWALACRLVPKAEAARFLGFWNISAVLPQIGASVLMGPLGSGISRYRPGLGWRVDYAVGAACVLAGMWFLRRVRDEVRE